METLPLSLGSFAVCLVLLGIGYILYTVFPITVLRVDKPAWTYRHQGYLLFLAIFLPSLLLPSAKLATENTALCDIVVMQQVSGGLTTNYSYSKICFNDTTHNANTQYYVTYANYRRFFWLYTGIMVAFYLFVTFNNFIINRRNGGA